MVFQAVHSLQRALQGDYRDVVNMKESSRQRLEALREAAIKVWSAVLHEYYIRGQGKGNRCIFSLNDRRLKHIDLTITFFILYIDICKFWQTQGITVSIVMLKYHPEIIKIEIFCLSSKHNKMF